MNNDERIKQLMSDWKRIVQARDFEGTTTVMTANIHLVISWFHEYFRDVDRDPRL